MLLQAALDKMSVEKAIDIVKKAKKSIDIIEVGTSLVLDRGMEAIRLMRKAFPEKKILADIKIMDGGGDFAEKVFLAGADIVTVMAVTNDTTIKDVILMAKQHSCEVMVDMMVVHDFETRAKQMDAFGADYICVHTAHDVQDENNNPLSTLRTAKGLGLRAKIAVAGGLKPDKLAPILSLKPDVLIVGQTIYADPNPAQAAINFKWAMEGSRATAE